MLKTETLILSDVRDVAKEYTPKMWNGLWDTGASRSSITRRVVDDLGDDIDVLIGMDIIQHGDFSITNVNNKTTFSFRTPSMKEIDYVKESKTEQVNNWHYKTGD